MTKKTAFAFLLALLFHFTAAVAQKVLDEGVIVYNVSIKTTANGKTEQNKGTYTFIIKGKEMRRELRLNNGFADISIFNGNTNNIYSLQNADGKKYAIQLSNNDRAEITRKYTGFTIRDAGTKKSIAGFEATKATVVYKNGTESVIYYTKDIIPGNELIYDLFPGIKVLPLSYLYDDNKGNIIEFTANSVRPEPVENQNFRIPADYKIITHTEYREMNK